MRTASRSSNSRRATLQGYAIHPRFATIPSPVIRYLINDFGKIVGYLTLSPQGPRPRSKPTLVDTDRHPAMSGPRPHINKKRHSSSMSFYESHRRRPSNPHRTLTERLMSLSASAPKALKLSMGPRRNNSLRSYKLIRSGDFRLFPPANFANSAILPEDKISTFFMQNFLPKKQKDSSLLCPSIPTGEALSSLLPSSVSDRRSARPVRFT